MGLARSRGPGFIVKLKTKAHQVYKHNIQPKKKKKTWNPYCYWSPARCQNNQTQLKPNYHPMPINIKNANYIHDKGSTPKIFNNNHSTFAKFS
jgi:hypothetical protein